MLQHFAVRPGLGLDLSVCQALELRGHLLLLYLKGVVINVHAFLGVLDLDDPGLVLSPSYPFFGYLLLGPSGCSLCCSASRRALLSSTLRASSSVTTAIKTKGSGISIIS